MTLDQKVSLLADQAGKCALCGTKCRGETDTNVDHDHTTGKIRAILCRGCNTGLGQFKDSPALLRKAAEYIEAHQTS